MRGWVMLSVVRPFGVSRNVYSNGASITRVGRPRRGAGRSTDGNRVRPGCMEGTAARGQRPGERGPSHRAVRRPVPPLRQLPGCPALRRRARAGRRSNRRQPAPMPPNRDENRSNRSARTILHDDRDILSATMSFSRAVAPILHLPCPRRVGRGRQLKSAATALRQIAANAATQHG